MGAKIAGVALLVLIGGCGGALPSDSTAAATFEPEENPAARAVWTQPNLHKKAQTVGDIDAGDVPDGGQ